ncbi:LysR family transcriptional regulator [Uliginosibacterium sp. H3]|uniref:LysR family transcriptional regulator n=1 Tax=Uliginosibacterium silvisoli TaxID=3114758 RepID=A0ABU6JZ72_9RHOO|nr:LysR family transcriptional regulator [Uliginosibacterium sp. H3]
MDKLKAMQTFASIADAGSLTGAAQTLGASLPAVVRTLAALETELGTRLFNRTTRRIALTEEGRRYLERCRQVLAAVAEADAELGAEQAEPQGLLRVTAPVLFGQLHVCDAITRFVQRYPRISVDVQLLDRVVNLVEEGIDVGIRIGALADSSLVAQRVGSLRRIVVATPDYLARCGTPQHPRDLLQHNCLRFSGSSAPWWSFEENGKTFNVPVQGSLSFNQAAPVAQACRAGLGPGMFISYQVAPWVLSGELQIVLEKYEPAQRPIHILYPQSRLLPVRTRVFIDWMKQELENLHEGWRAQLQAWQAGTGSAPRT